MTLASESTPLVASADGANGSTPIADSVREAATSRRRSMWVRRVAFTTATALILLGVFELSGGARIFRGKALRLSLELDADGKVVSWPRPVVVVPAVFNEFDAGTPDWAEPTVNDAYAVAPLYDRRDNTSQYYVPNYGFEGGAYLKFVVDYYDNLPDVMVFMQADAMNVVSGVNERIQAIVDDPQGVTFEQLNSATVLGFPGGDWVDKTGRDWGSLHWGYDEDLGEQCWRNIASWFGYYFDPAAAPRKSFTVGSPEH